MNSLPDNPLIDEAAVRHFCDLIFGYLSGQATVRLISELGTPDQRPDPYFVPTADVADFVIRVAARAARDHRAVFVVPGSLKPGKRAKVEDVIESGVILVDLDHGDINAKRNHLAHNLGTPSMEVASGGITDEGQVKLHLYWKLSEAATGDDLDLVADVRGELAHKIGGDESFKTITQPVRVPGTIHGKHGKMTPVRLLACTNAEYHLSELADAISAMPPMAGGGRIVIDTGKPRGLSANDLKTTIIREGGVDPETRYSANSKIIGHWLRQVRDGRCTLESAWTAVDQQNTAMIRPPWDQARLRWEFNALLNLDVVNNGPMPDYSASTEDGGAAPDLSEDALAQNFSRKRAALWRHVGAWSQWFNWTGKVWKKDELGQAFQAVRLVCRESALASNKPQEARKLASTKTIQAVLKIISNDPAIALSPDAFDQHQMLINTPAGILDLETGTISPHDNALLLTQITHASPGTECPQWIAFLDTVTDGNADLQSYLARAAGYCLSGSTREQVFFFLHGSGANGKSVFLQTLAWVLGDYVATATADAFTSRGPARHLTELAGLRAARLVLVSETEAGEGWAEARIKSVTGGEKIRANFMYRDHFEFTPQFKLMVAGNHRPVLGEVGEAMRRRLHVIPFTVTIPPEARNPHLADLLKSEANGILGWMIDGCADWQQSGLRPPALVTGAAEEYFAAEDYVGHWLDECCQIGSGNRATSKALFASWSAWAKAGGFEPRSTRFLGEQLRARGFQSGKAGTDRGWVGLTLRLSQRAGDEA